MMKPMAANLIGVFKMVSRQEVAATYGGTFARHGRKSHFLIAVTITLCFHSFFSSAAKSVTSAATSTHWGLGSSPILSPSTSPTEAPSPDRLHPEGKRKKKRKKTKQRRQLQPQTEATTTVIESHTPGDSPTNRKHVGSKKTYKKKAKKKRGETLIRQAPTALPSKSNFDPNEQYTVVSSLNPGTETDNRVHKTKKKKKKRKGTSSQKDKRSIKHHEELRPRQGATTEKISADDNSSLRPPPYHVQKRKKLTAALRQLDENEFSAISETPRKKKEVKKQKKKQRKKRNTSSAIRSNSVWGEEGEALSDGVQEKQRKQPAVSGASKKHKKTKRKVKRKHSSRLVHGVKKSDKDGGGMDGPEIAQAYNVIVRDNMDEKQANNSKLDNTGDKESVTSEYLTQTIFDSSSKETQIATAGANKNCTLTEANELEKEELMLEDTKLVEGATNETEAERSYGAVAENSANNFQVVSDATFVPIDSAEVAAYPDEAYFDLPIIGNDVGNETREDREIRETGENLSSTPSLETDQEPDGMVLPKEDIKNETSLKPNILPDAIKTEDSIRSMVQPGDSEDSRQMKTDEQINESGVLQNGRDSIGNSVPAVPVIEVAAKTRGCNDSMPAFEVNKSYETQQMPKFQDDDDQDVLTFIGSVLEEDVRGWIDEPSDGGNVQTSESTTVPRYDDNNEPQEGFAEDDSNATKIIVASTSTPIGQDLQSRLHRTQGEDDEGDGEEDDDSDGDEVESAAESSKAPSLDRGGGREHVHDEHASSQSDFNISTGSLKSVDVAVGESGEDSPETRANTTASHARVFLAREALESGGDDDSDIKVSVVTWNLAEESPSEDDASFIRNFRKAKSELVLISGQECENIKPRRTEGRRSREFRRLMIKMLGKQYVPIALHLLGGIQFGLFARKSFLKEIEFVAIADVTCGIGNVFHNKGAIAAFVQVTARTPSSDHEALTKDKTKRAKSLRMMFVTAHMAAHVKNSDARDSDFWRISSELEGQVPERFLPLNRDQAVDGKPSGSVLFDSMDRVFFCGDLNYRLDLPREFTEYMVHEISKSSPSSDICDRSRLNLLCHDQLTRSIAERRAFPGFSEGKILFPPTFKFDKLSEDYDTSHKQRIPAWTDRILFKPIGTRVLEYTSVPSAQHSDHRPVHGTFRVSMRGKELQKRIGRRRTKQLPQ